MSNARSGNSFAKPGGTPRPVKDLVVIESPGKIDALRMSLRKAGLHDVHILATFGHFMDMPQEFNPLGIDYRLNETLRTVRRPAVVEQVRSWAAQAQRVLIACDSDQEGDVLAHDLVEHVLEGHKNVWRVRLGALDSNSVRAAFTDLERVNARDAWPGTVRRMLDRLIGAGFSRRGDEGRIEVVVGRVQSALLGAASQEPMPFAQATLTLPACDRKDPYVAVIDVYEHNRAEVEGWIEESKRFIAEGKCVQYAQTLPAPDFQPWNHGESILAIAQATGRDIGDVSKSMQRLYEAGRMSYPRSNANALTPEGLGTISRLAEENGVRFDGSRVAQFTRQSRHAHESPRPLGKDVNITSPLLVLSPDEAALSLLTRHLVACGQPHAVHRPDPSGLPAWAQKIPFERKVSLWLRPWPRRPAEPGLRMITPTEQALSLLLKHGLGRPSTQINHAERFAARQMLDAHMKLSDRAHAWLDQTPELLRNPGVSSRIEQMINASADRLVEAVPPALLLRNLLEGLELWPQIEPLLDQVEARMAHVGAISQSGLPSLPGLSQPRSAPWGSGVSPAASSGLGEPRVPVRQGSMQRASKPADDKTSHADVRPVA